MTSPHVCHSQCHASVAAVSAARADPASPPMQDQDHRRNRDTRAVTHRSVEIAANIRDAHAFPAICTRVHRTVRSILAQLRALDMVLSHTASNPVWQVLVQILTHLKNLYGAGMIFSSYFRAAGVIWPY